MSDGGSLGEAWSFCKRRSKSVEVFYRNMDGDKILTKVHFPFDPDVSCLYIILYVLMIFID